MILRTPHPASDRSLLPQSSETGVGDRVLGVGKRATQSSVLSPQSSLSSFDWLAVALTLVVAGYFASLVRYGYHLGEDGDVVYLIYRAFSGQRPYIDFASGYAPGFFYGSAALFHLFGVNILVLRWAMVVTNTLAVLGLYLLARRVVPAALALVPALGYVALMPVFRGEFATFNIPYPAWYVVLTWVASTLAFLRFASTRRLRWIALAGLLAGIGCSIKPNTGAFDLAALGLTLLFISAPEGNRLQRIAWWALLAGILVAISAVFGFRLDNRDARLMLWPVFALAVLRAAVPRRTAAHAIDPEVFLAAAVALVGGFAVITFPWMGYYLAALGWQGFSRDVLFIGTGHALFFYMAIRALGMWDVAMAAAAAGALLGGWMVWRGRLRTGPVLAAAGILAAAGGAVVLWKAPMPAGFVKAVTERLQFLGFGAAILAHWAGVAFIAWRLGRGRRSAETLAPVAIAIGAPVMFLDIYPRSDFFHWVLSTPLTLVLGVMLYWGVARLWWPRRMGAAAAALPFYAAIVILIWPGASVSVRLHTSSPAYYARLGLDRAPIVLERGRRQRLENLRHLVEYIRSHSKPTDTALGFPNLHLVNFLSGRQVPGRFGSFNPGWPDHVVEAEVIEDLEKHRTPLVISNHDQQLFMGQAPLYYFMLRQYVRHHYELVASFGSFDVLRRKGLASSPSGLDATAVAGSPSVAPAASSPSGAGTAPVAERTPTAGCREALGLAERTLPEDATSLAPCWSADNAPLQERAVAVARASHDPRGIVPLAEALHAGTLTPRASLLAVRAIGEIADARVLPILIRTDPLVQGRVHDELRTAMWVIAGRSLIESYVFVPRDDGEAALRHDSAASAAAKAWVDDLDPRLRFLGAWLAGTCQQRAAIPSLLRMLEDPHVEVQAMAGNALLKLGVGEGVVEPLLQTMTHDEMFVPSIVLGWSLAHPMQAREKLAQTFRDGNRLQRETVAFLIGALGDPALGKVVRGGINDPSPRVRIASTWALGALHFEPAERSVEKEARSDPRQSVRWFAEASEEELKR